MKKLTALFGSCLFFFIVMCLYLVLDQFGANFEDDGFKHEAEQVRKNVEDLERKIDELKYNLDFSNRAIDTLNDKVDDLPPKTNTKRTEQTTTSSYVKFVPDKETSLDKNQMCLFTDVPLIHSQDIRMLDVFDEVPFDNIDGGVWKQGWDIRYEEESFRKQKLQVFVMPHSHNDPGWLKTVDQYFHDQTVKIITNIVDALAKDEKRKFIWAESSYAAMWWDQASPAKKQLFQQQVRNGQLEIVTGGWVMNDEANPHYFSMLDQMVEGHQWLEKHVGAKPKHGWAIDPFGYSSTMAYLLKRMGFDAMLIQRVHYRIKKYLAQHKDLEFMWRQNWDHSKSTDIFTHVMPFYSYDVPHTCGPEPRVCCQFDFKRLPGGGVYCPWHVSPKEITNSNVKDRSIMLLDQYKKKAQLYRSNVVLAPLGDDFRYDKIFEIQAQFDNYERIMEYVNSHPELNAEIKFGTLKDYFEAVAKREGVKSGEKPATFKSLGGDFFTYADRDDHYWSGYYTSRSFFKHMDRELSAHLRAAEIIYSLSLAHSRQHGNFPGDEIYDNLLSARKSLALFQHHDGVTGTSRDPVVNDYGTRMHNAIKSSITIMQTSAQYLLTAKRSEYKHSGGDPVFSFGEDRMSFDSIPSKGLVVVSKTPRFVVVYNPLAQERQQVVTVHVTSVYVKVIGPDGNPVLHQVSLLWKDGRVAVSTKYELAFVSITPPLGMSRYSIVEGEAGGDCLAKVTTYNTQGISHDDKFTVESGNKQQINVKSKHLTAVFDVDTGLMTDLSAGSVVLKKMQIRFMRYGTVSNMDRSGAYLFLPNGEAVSIDTKNPPVRVTTGAIYTEVMAYLQYVTHSVRVYHTETCEARTVDIRNTLDIRGTSNFELVMRVESGLHNQDREFFTDLNGFQMQRRKTLAKLPLQANFYPAPAMIFIQDRKSRLTLQTQQANGVASLEQGFIEVVLDRRLNQDDNRGLGQGVMDNRLTLSAFRLILEDFSTPQNIGDKPSPIAYPSSLSVTLAHQLQYPLYTFHISPTQPPEQLSTIYAGLKTPLPCDTHVVNMKALQDNINTAPSKTTALFLHRVGYDCRFKDTCSERRLTFEEIFNPLTVTKLEENSLSLMHKLNNLEAGDRIKVPPMEIQAYKLNLA